MMGLSELVLKVPASEVTSRPPLQGQPQSSLSPMSTSPENRNRNISNRAPMISGSGSSPISSSLPKAQQPIKSKMKKRESCSKTHSRESSGASNLSVRFTVNDETVRQVQANPSEPGGLVTVRNIGSSQEDITLSDRLSQDDLDEEELLGIAHHIFSRILNLPKKFTKIFFVFFSYEVAVFLIKIKIFTQKMAMNINISYFMEFLA